MSKKKQNEQIIDANATTALKFGENCFALLAGDALSGSHTMSCPSATGGVPDIYLLFKSDHHAAVVRISQSPVTRMDKRKDSCSYL